MHSSFDTNGLPEHGIQIMKFPQVAFSFIKKANRNSYVKKSKYKTTVLI